MSHIIEDRVLETTTTTGTGAIALAAAITGFRRFNAVCAVGDTVPYFIEAIDSLGQPTGDYEYGIGTYSAANQLTRTTVNGSSNGGALVNFTAGSKNVGVSMLSENAAIPAGAVFHFASNAAPRGFVKANGASLSRAAYPVLWAYAQASGNIAASDAAWAAAPGQFSPGDGATTFRVPDLRGEFIRGWDDARGVDPARAIGTAQADSLKDHFHATANVNVPGSGGGSGWTYNYNNSGAPGSAQNTGGMSAAPGAETRPRNIALLACIKY